MTRILRERHLVAWSALTPLILGVLIAAIIASRSRHNALESSRLSPHAAASATPNTPASITPAGDLP